MIKRFFYALKMGFRYKHALKQYLNQPVLNPSVLNQSVSNFNQPVLQTKTILNLNPEQLQTQGIKALILDFDGVLAAHGKEKPNPTLEPWLSNCLACYAPHSVFVLTNRPSEERFKYLQTKFPALQIIHTHRKKPYPEGIYQVIQNQGLDPKSILIIDDRLLTGILAAEIAGIRACYITEPLISFKSHPIKESAFWALRKIERFLIQWLG